MWVAKHKTKRVALISLARLFIAVSTTLILIIVFKMGALGRILGLLIGNLAIFSIALYDLVKYTKLHFSLKKIAKTLVLGFPLMFSVFSYVIMNTSDKYMLERMAGLSEVGLYNIAYTFSAIPLFLMIGFNQVWQPVFYENMKNGYYDILSKLSKYYVIIFTTISLFVVFFSNEVFNVFVNNNYINAIKVIPWIVIGVFFLGLTNLISSIYGYQKRFKEIGSIAAITASINVILNYFLISKSGLIGAAIASAISYFIYFLILFYRIKKRILEIYSLKIFSLVIIIMIITCVSFLFLNSHYLEFNVINTVIKIVIFTIIIYSFFLFGVLNSNDKKAIISLFRNKRRN